MQCRFVLVHMLKGIALQCSAEVCTFYISFLSTMGNFEIKLLVYGNPQLELITLTMK